MESRMAVNHLFSVRARVLELPVRTAVADRGLQNRRY